MLSIKCTMTTSSTNSSMIQLYNNTHRLRGSSLAVNSANDQVPNTSSYDSRYAVSSH